MGKTILQHVGYIIVGGREVRLAKSPAGLPHCPANSLVFALLSQTQLETLSHRLPMNLQEGG
jgi:hypothetical protein